MPKVGNSVSSSELPCDRCGSKRKVAKVWTEKIQNSSGFMTLQHTKIDCTNKECQAAFEKLIQADIDKREKMKLTKMKNAQSSTPPKTA